MKSMPQKNISRTIKFREHYFHYLVIVGLILGSCIFPTTRSVARTKIIETEGWIFNPTSMHYYKLVNSCAGWLSCEEAAVNEGGHLVTINNATEQNWLVSTFGGTDLFWIGFTDDGTEGTWYWISGEVASYTNWAPGEPSNSGNAEHYALMNWTESVTLGLWNDGHKGAVTSGAIIERVEPPIKIYMPLVKQ